MQRRRDENRRLPEHIRMRHEKRMEWIDIIDGDAIKLSFYHSALGYIPAMLLIVGIPFANATS
jgi:hypothetical protein